MVRAARHLGARTVRGNHDDAGLAAYEGWQNGGGLKRKHKWVKELGHKNAHFLYHMPFSLHFPTHSMSVVHAGVVPDVRPPSWWQIDVYCASVGSHEC